MAVIKKGQNPFKPRARLLVLLGEQLITNEVIAVVEIVKNAYDADATEANIILENVQEPEKGKIVIEDNGTGMSLETIMNVWLEPATDFRKRQRDERRRTEIFKRFPLGEKGVGRFAAHKLGDIVEVITKQENSKEEVVVTVDWNKFQKDDYLDKIPVTWILRDPEVFTGKRKGAQVTIKNLRKQWTTAMVNNLYVRLQVLCSPFIEKTDFKIKLQAPEFKEVIEKLPEIREMLNKSRYRLEGEIDEDGILKFDYKFYNETHPQLSREMKDVKTEDAKDPKKFKSRRKPFCGPFRVRFYVWDLDPATLGETIQRAYYLKFVKPHTGIRIYRDGFRVWPYGEPYDDSFSLDSRRVNNPTQCLSRNQIIGIVELSSTKNPDLRDKTDREGLILNREYEDFSDLVIGCMSVLEAERRKDKDKIDSMREKKKPADEVTQAIAEMKNHIKNKGHLDFYKNDIKKIESAYIERVRNIIEPLYVSAGLGIAYTLPVHEIIRNLDDLENILSNLIEKMKTEKAESSVIENLKKVLQTTDIVNDLVRGVGKLTRKGRPETAYFRSVIYDAYEIVKMRLNQEKIDLEITGDEKLKRNISRNLIITAILNLIDNSIYWLLKIEKNRKIIIRIDHDMEGRPRIIVSDNGPGIKDDPALLVQPFFTRKPDGSGLGLYIVDHIMKAHEGELRFLLKGEEKGLLEGANVALIFPKEKEIK